MTSMWHALAVLLALVMSRGTVLAQSAATNGVVADAEIRKILAERVDTHHQSDGIVVGVIEPAAAAS